LDLLRKAREASDQVRQEIERLNEDDLTSSGPESRAPTLTRARNQIRLLDLEIRNLLAADDSVELDETQVKRLNVLAERLDKAIEKNALLDAAGATLTAVLNAVSEVRETLA
jgi:hypothetical protein